MNSPDKPFVTATEIGEHIRFSACERRFKLGYNKRALARRLPFYERLFNPLDPVLQEVGRDAEDTWERSLREGAGFEDLSDFAERPSDAKQTPWDELLSKLHDIPENTPAYGREVQIQGEIAAFQIEGRIDFVVLLWRNDRPTLRLVECKASRRDRTYHRIQVGLYYKLLLDWLQHHELMISDHSITEGDVECVVARIDESTNEGQEILALPPLDLNLVLADTMLLLAEDGPLARILQKDLDDLPFKLEPKCDGCVFSTDCLPECGRQRRIELLGLDPADTRALSTAGVRTIDDLADLDLGSAEAGQVRGDPSFSGGLDIMQERSRARRSTLPGGSSPPDEYEVSPLTGRWESQLPEHGQDAERLIRVHLNVDYDYTENRVGALAAHVTKSQVSAPFRNCSQTDGLNL